MDVNWCKEIVIGSKKKYIKVLHADIVELSEKADLLVCSAYKNKYAAYEGTLIGNLYAKKGISVEKEADNPELDCRKECNYWVSGVLEGDISRIGCIELLDISERDNTDISRLKVICESFSSVYNMLVHMDKVGLSIKRVCLPVLGSGNQGIELCYIIPPLLKQCISALQDIEQIEEIVFCENNCEKATQLIEGLKSIESTKDAPELFISYCSAQRKQADLLRTMLSEKGVKCWMAPYSIPAGSSYQQEIPMALGNVSTVLLVMSKEAENSRWVQKEVGCAIGARRMLVPFRSKAYPSSSQFAFLLDGEQIFEADEWQSDHEKCEAVVKYLLNRMGKSNGEENEKRNIVPESPKLKEKETLSGKEKLFLGIGIVIIIELLLILLRIY